MEAMSELRKTMDGVLSELKGLREDFAKLLEIAVKVNAKMRRPRVNGKTEIDKGKPEMRPYGDWDFNPVGAWSAVFSLGRNWSGERKSKTHMRHELLRHLCQSPCNRNFWPTGSVVRVYTGTEIVTQHVQDFEKSHLKEMNKFMEKVLEDHKEDLVRLCEEEFPHHWERKIVWLAEYGNDLMNIAVMEHECKLDIEFMKDRGKQSIQRMRKYLNSSVES